MPPCLQTEVPWETASLTGERHRATQTGWEDLAAGRQPGALPPPLAAAETSAPPRNCILG